jgi:hypothetical protein
MPKLDTALSSPLAEAKGSTPPGAISLCEKVVAQSERHRRSLDANTVAGAQLW